MISQSRLELVIDSRRAEADLKRLEGSLGGVERQGGMTAAALTRLNGVVALLAGAFSVQKITAYADGWSDLNARVNNVTKDLNVTESVMQSISATARRTYSSLEQTAETFLRNSTALTELGYSLETQIQLSDALNNSMVISGLRGQEAESVFNALSRAFALGELRGDQLNTVIMNGGRLTEALAASFGVTTLELQKLSKDGLLTTGNIVEGVIGQLETLQAEADGMAAVVSEGFGQIGNAAQEMVGRIDQALGASESFAELLVGASDMMRDSIEPLVDNLDFVKDAAAGVALVVGGRFVASLGAATAAKIAATQQAVAYQLALARMAGISGTAAASQIALGAATRGAAGALALVGGPLGAAVIAMGAIYYFREELGLTQQQAGLTEDEIASLRQEMADMDGTQITQTLAQVEDALMQVGLKAAAAREELAQLRSENRGSGVLGFEAGSVGEEIRGMQAVAEYTEKMTELGQRRTAMQEELNSRTNEGTTAMDDMVVTADRLTDEIDKQAAAAKGTAREVASLADAYESLLDRITPNRREARQYARDLGVLNLALASGRMTTTQYMQAMGLLQESFQAAQRETTDLSDTVSVEVDAMGRSMQRFEDSIDSAFVDAFRGAFDSFKSFSDRLIDGFKNLLAELAYQALMKPIVVQFTQAMGGMLGIPGMGGGFGGFNLSSLGSLGNIGGMFGGGMAAAGTAPIGYASGFGAQAATGTYTGWAGSAAAGAANPGMFASMGGWSGIAGGLGAGYAGMQIGNMIAPDAKFGTAAGGLGALGGFALGGPLGAAIGGAIAPAISKGLFGGSWQTKDGGLQLGVAGGDITGNQYERQRKSGGLFRGSRYRTNISALDNEFEAALSEAYQMQEMSLRASLDVLGQQSAALNSFSSGLEKISTKGKSEAEVEAAVQEWLQNIVNRAAQSVVDPSQYAMAGETTVETLNRLATALTGVNPILEQLHGNAFAASLAGGDAAASLVTLSGGMEQFALRADYYYQNILTEAERQERAMAAAAQAIGAFTARTGQVINSTDALRDLVDSIDLTTSSGRELYNEAMNLAPALVEIERGLERVGQRFDQMLQEVESALASAEQQVRSAEDAVRSAWKAFDNQSFGMQLELLALMGDAEGALALERERELASIDESLRPMRERIWAMQDEAEAQQRATQAAQGYIRELTRVRDQLNTSLGNVSQWIDQRLATSGTPAMNLEAAGEQFARQLVLAENGDRDALQNITQYADRYLAAGEGMFASGSGFQRIQEDVLASLEGLPKALSDAEFIVDGFRDIVSNEMAREIERAIFSSQYKIDTLIEFAADASKLPKDLRTILGEQAHRLDSTLNYLLGENQLDNELRRLALESTNNLVSTVDYITGFELSDADKLLALSSSNRMTAVIDYVIGTDIGRDSRILALEESNRYSAIVDMILGRDINETDRRLALESINSFTSVIDYVIRSPLTGGDRRLALAGNNSYEALIGYYVDRDVSQADRELALASGNRYLANIEYYIGRDISSTDRRLALNSNNRYVSTIDQLIGKQITGGDRSLALNSTNRYLTTVDAVMKKGIAADVRTFGLANSNSIMTTIDGILASRLPSDVRTLALEDSNRFVTTLEAALADGRLTGDERKLLDAKSERVVKTLVTSGGLNLKPEQLAVINAASGTRRLELIADVAFGRTDLDELQNIDDNTKSLEERAFDQLRELNSLVGEMARTTDQFVGLNSGITSLTKSINALGVAQAEVARIERDRAAAEKAERERIEIERAISGFESAAAKAEYQSTALAARLDPRDAGNITRLIDNRMKDGVFSNAEWQEMITHLSGVFGRDSLEYIFGREYAAMYRNQTRANEERAKLNAFATGGVFTNSIINNPTMFDMGLMGEAGPEAIVPLSRGAGGRLGIDASGLMRIPDGPLDLPMPNIPLPQFPQLGSNDVLQVLRDVKRELVETRKQNKRLQEENNRHAAAAVAVQQAGFNGQINEQKKGNVALGTMASKARLEGSRR